MVQFFWQPQRLALLLGLTALVLIAGACGDDGEEPVDGGPITRDPETPIVIPASEPIVVGVSVALTGGPKGMRGTEYRDAVIVAVERWKDANGDQLLGHDIEIHAEDDGCNDSDIAALAAGHLLRGRGDHQVLPGLVGVIGPQCSGGAERAIPIYAEAGVVAISGSATTTSLTEDQRQPGFFFRTAYRNDLEGTLIGLFVSTNPELGIDSVYLIDNGGTYGEDLADSAQEVAEEGGVPVTRESIVEGTVDFTDLAGRIVQANPGFVAYAGFNPEAALLYRQLRDAGYDGWFGAGDGAASVTGFVEPVGELAEGVLFAGCTFPLHEDFLDDFVNLHGDAPTAAFPAQYADAATILLNAVKKVARDDDGSLVIDPVELRDAVRASVLEGGVSGSIAFDDNGDRLPPGIASLSRFVDYALENLDVNGYIDLGLIPCQVQDGKLVNLLGPGAGEMRLP